MNFPTSPHVLSPEFLVLLWCANSLFRSKDDPPVPQEVFPDGQLDWDRLLDLARAHASTPLVHEALSRLEPSAAPDTILDVLDEHRKAIACSNLGRTGELLGLLAAFQEQGLRVISYKGPVLALSCYGNLSLREFGDLDFLVDKQDAEECAAIVETHGYKHTRQYEWEDTFLKDGQGEVDLHSSLSPRTFPVSLPFERLWEYAHKVRLADVDIHTFCPEHNLLALCIQICKDAWEDRLTSNKLSDVAALISLQPLDWHFVSSEASTMQVSRIVYFGLALTGSLLSIEIPDFLLTEINRHAWIGKRVCETTHRIVNVKVRRQRDILRRMQLHYCLQETLVGKISQMGLPFSRVRKVEG